MPKLTVHELLAEARDQIAGDDPQGALDSLCEAVQQTYEIAVAAAQRAGVPQYVDTFEP